MLSVQLGCMHTGHDSSERWTLPANKNTALFVLSDLGEGAIRLVSWGETIFALTLNEPTAASIVRSIIKLVFAT